MGQNMLTGNQYVEDLTTVSKQQLKTPDDWQNYLVYQPEIATAILNIQSILKTTLFNNPFVK